MKKLFLSLSILLSLGCTAIAQVPNFGSPMVPNGGSGGGGGTVPANLTATTNPTVSNDSTQGYQVGSLWQNANTGQIWMARSVTASAAVWNMLELSDFPGYIVGNWYIPFGTYSLSTGTNPGSGSIRLMPGYIKERVSINTLGERITTLSAGGNIQAAVYANNPTTNHPTGTPLLETTASMSTASVASVNSTVCAPANCPTAGNVQLEAGLYWFATNFDNATATTTSVLTSTPMSSFMLGSTGQSTSIQGSSGMVGLAVTQTFGTWPDLTSGSFTEIVAATTIPVVQFKTSSVP